MQCNFSLPEISFGRALPTSKKADYSQTMTETKKALGIDDGLSLLKIDSAAMPSENDTGVGKLNSDEACGFVDYLSFYTGANAVKIFPFGQYTKTFGHFYCPYLKTAITTGEDNINLFNLVNSEVYGNLLDEKDALEFVQSNNEKRQVINFENELGCDENYPILKPLRKAYDNFKAGYSPEELQIEFEEFKKDPFVEENYTRLALYPFVGESDPDLFKDFENSKEKQARFEQYKKEYADEIEFFKFRQFIAQKEHKSAKEKINANGQKLFGDCLIGFSNQEIWAHKDAFLPNTSIGLYTWGLPALDFDKILDPKSSSHKVFDDKISFFLKNFDGIRFDVGWCYAIARTENDDRIEKTYDMKQNLFGFIEKRAREIKGEDFDTKNLVYEMDGFDKLFDWNYTPPKPLENVRGRVNVLTNEYQHDNGLGWGHPRFFESTGLSQDEFIMGTNNHDGSNLRQLSESKENSAVEKRENTARILSKELNIPEDKILSDPKEFVKAKFAQLFTTKNQFFFFVDALGSDVDVDDQTINPDNYRFRVNKDYERQYHTALQNGRGFNAMEALSYVMRARGLDKTNKKLYDKVHGYGEFLREKGPKTEKEANEKEAKENVIWAQALLAPFARELENRPLK